MVGWIVVTFLFLLLSFSFFLRFFFSSFLSFTFFFFSPFRFQKKKKNSFFSLFFVLMFKPCPERVEEYKERPTGQVDMEDLIWERAVHGPLDIWEKICKGQHQEDYDAERVQTHLGAIYWVFTAEHYGDLEGFGRGKLEPHVEGLAVRGEPTSS